MQVATLVAGRAAVLNQDGNIREDAGLSARSIKVSQTGRR
jgi:isoaspartyl peptidase/L-asparaginase-like protein (Ntn-hydrolase superfamily)